jgi:hypothetical protein
VTLTTHIVLIAHTIATGLMAGLCLFVAVVHYPLFARVGRTDFPAYSQQHARRTTWIVAPLMLIEAATAAWLVLTPPPGIAPWWPWANAGALALIWLITFALNVPQHARLAQGFDDRTHRALLASNTIRTILWLARAIGATIALSLATR